jgi:hypothetical protein
MHRAVGHGRGSEAVGLTAQGKAMRRRPWFARSQLRRAPPLLAKFLLGCRRF